MTDTPGGGRRWIPLVAAIVVVLDQITKAICVAEVPLHARIPVIDGFLALTHVHNRGMAFGLFNGIEASWLRWLLAGVAVAAVVIIWSYARDESHRTPVLIAFGAILGGAVGNLIDRVRHGYVVDFILAHWDRYEFPAFNVADSAITIGGVILFLALARDTSQPATEEASPLAESPSSEAGDVRRDRA